MALNIEHKVENQGLTKHGQLTADEFNQILDQINKNTPQEVASEDVFEQMVADGNIVDGQIYFIPEE